VVEKHKKTPHKNPDKKKTSIHKNRAGAFARQCLVSEGELQGERKFGEKAGAKKRWTREKNPPRSAEKTREKSREQGKRGKPLQEEKNKKNEQPPLPARGSHGREDHGQTRPKNPGGIFLRAPGGLRLPRGGGWVKLEKKVKERGTPRRGLGEGFIGH